MRGETTSAVEIAWVKYTEERHLYQPFVDSAFAAGFTAGVAHASTAADPARLARLESLLREIGGNVGEDANGGYYVKSLGGDVLIDQHKRIAAILGPAE